MTTCPHDGAPPHSHVTLDWDGTTQRPQKFYLWRDSNVISCVHWRKSSSRKGLHVLVCLVKDISPLEKFLFRMWNHDDIWRLTYDIIRYDESQIMEEIAKGAGKYAEGTLFDGKGKFLGSLKEVGEWQGV